MKFFLIIVLFYLPVLINAQQAKLVLPIGHTNALIGYKITPDEKYLITASKDGTGKIWNYRTGKFMYDLKLHTNQLTGIDIAKNGSFVVLGSADGTYSKWDVATGKLLYHSARKASINHLFLLPGDSSVLLIKEFVLVIGFLKEDTPDILFDEENYSNKDSKKRIAISPDYTMLAVSQENHGIKIFDLLNIGLGYAKVYLDKVVIDSSRYYDLSKLPGSLYFINNNELIVSVGGYTMAGFNIDSSKQTFLYHKTFHGGILNKNRTFMAFTNGRDDTVRIWNTQLKQIVALIPNKKQLAIVKFSELSSNIILCKGKTVQEWSIDGTLIQERLLEEKKQTLVTNTWGSNRTASILSINDNETIAITEMENGLQTINWKTGKTINEFIGKIGEVKKSIISKSGKWLFEVKENYSNYWNLHTMTATRFPEHLDKAVKNIFLTNVADIILLQYENSFNLFDCTTEKTIYSKPIEWSSEVLMLKGDTSFLTINAKQIQKRLVSTGAIMKEWEMPYRVYNAAVSNNDSLLVYNAKVSQNNDSLIVWDLVNDRKIVSAYRPSQYVEPGYFVVYTPKYIPAFRFSDDNKYLFYGSGENGSLTIAQLPYEEYEQYKYGDETETDTIKYEFTIMHEGWWELFSTTVPITVISSKTTVIRSEEYENGESAIKAYNYEKGDILFSLPYSRFQRIKLYDSINNQLYTATKTEWLLWDIAKKKLIKKWELPVGMNAETVIPEKKQFLISSNDRIGIQYMDEKKPIYFFSTLDNNESIAHRNDRYYKVTPDAAASLSWNIDNKFYDFDQWDIQYNRPDKILELTDEKELANAYYKAYLKRLKKNGLTEKNFNQTNQSPQAIIMNEITDGDEVANDVFNLKVKIIPIKNTVVNKIFVLVNGCPVLGKQGFKTLLIKDTVLQFSIKMSADLNNIKVSCMDKFGNESVQEQLQVIYHPKSSIQEKQHFIGIGINQFSNPEYNLSWSVKDIRDLALRLKSKYPNIIIDTLFDENVTKENILALKKKLLLLNENDKVIVSYSGHGVLSKEFDYFLSTYSINFEKPEEKGLSYDDLENLLDSIKPRQKLMFIDACHSGEVDKDEIEKVEASKKELEKNGVVTKSTIKVKPKKSVGMANSFELMQSLFVNVGKGTGATIISAAGGMQYAQERGDLKNGVFTYSVLEAFNKHTTLKVSELKKTVGERVTQLTNGLQKPTSRNETNNYDWLVW